MRPSVFDQAGGRPRALILPGEHWRDWVEA